MKILLGGLTFAFKFPRVEESSVPGESEKTSFSLPVVKIFNNFHIKFGSSVRSSISIDSVRLNVGVIKDFINFYTDLDD